MHHCMGRPLYCLKCFTNNMLSRLRQHLHCYIVRDHLPLNQRTHKIVFCIGSRWKPYFNLFKSYVNQKLEKFQFLLQAHRLDQCLISIPQIYAAPYGRLCNIFLFHPLIGYLRRHKILPLIFFIILHDLFLHK